MPQRTESNSEELYKETKLITVFSEHCKYHVTMERWLHRSPDKDQMAKGLLRDWHQPIWENNWRTRQCQYGHKSMFWNIFII